MHPPGRRAVPYPTGRNRTVETKRLSLWEEFPEFKILKYGDGHYKVSCRECFHGRSANWTRPRAVVVGGHGVREWISEHEHELSLEQAAAEWLAFVCRNKTAKRMLSSYFRIAGWVQPKKTLPIAKLAEHHCGTPDVAVQAHALAAAVSGVSA